MIGNPRKALTLFAFITLTILFIKNHPRISLFSPLSLSFYQNPKNPTKGIRKNNQSDTMKKKMMIMIKIPLMSLAIWLLFLISVSHALPGINFTISLISISSYIIPHTYLIFRKSLLCVDNSDKQYLSPAGVKFSESSLEEVIC